MTVFYERILENYRHEITTQNPQSLPDLAPYSTIIFCREHMLGYNFININDGDSIYTRYLRFGGNIIIAGTRQVVPTNGFSGERFFFPTTFPYQFLNLGGIKFPPITNSEFEGADSESADFSDFYVDSLRADRITIPYVPPPGRLFGIGTLIPIDSSEVIYRYRAVNPDTSAFHGQPVGIVHHTDIYNTAVLEFPLYYTEEPISFDILHTILEEFGETQTSADDNESILPTTTALLQNYPNPFNARTSIGYQLSGAAKVQISIYNILGQKVEVIFDGYRGAGNYSEVWDASEMPSGIYFARLAVESDSESIKMMLLK